MVRKTLSTLALALMIAAVAAPVTLASESDGLEVVRTRIHQDTVKVTICNTDQEETRGGYLVVKALVGNSIIESVRKVEVVADGTSRVDVDFNGTIFEVTQVGIIDNSDPY